VVSSCRRVDTLIPDTFTDILTELLTPNRQRMRNEYGTLRAGAMNLPYANCGCQVVWGRARPCNFCDFISDALRDSEQLPALGALNQGASTGND
jgi:hypothetical protein